MLRGNMWVRTISIANFRSISKAQLEFSRGIILLIGRNNAGKSTLLLPMAALQEDLPQLARSDIRIGATDSRIHFTLEDIDAKYWDGQPSNLHLAFEPKQSHFVLKASIEGKTQGVIQVPRIKAKEPHNFIYPFFSKRKVATLVDQVTEDIVEKVLPSFENLNAKIDRLSNPEFLPAHELYMRACNEIFGFKITTAHTPGGKRGVYTVRNMLNIPLLSMGEGVMNVVGLLVHLAVAENQLFLIEEPENDVHPRALKSLLDIIIEKSSVNQFLITTHSNIVLKRLGAADGTRLFHLDANIVERLPTTIVNAVPPGPAARREILEELGYELSDEEMWAGWLFLEESSAEKIVREYLIPWFAPALQQRLRTFSCRSRSEVSVKFRDFNDLFVFLHLEPRYKNRAWVVIDGGVAEAEIIDAMRAMYQKSGWHRDRFLQLNKHDFEEYYPAAFASKVSAIHTIGDKQKRQAAKAELLGDVEAWIRRFSGGGHSDNPEDRARSNRVNSARNPPAAGINDGTFAIPGAVVKPGLINRRCLRQLTHSRTALVAAREPNGSTRSSGVPCVPLAPSIRAIADSVGSPWLYSP